MFGGRGFRTQFAGGGGGLFALRGDPAGSDRRKRFLPGLYRLNLYKRAGVPGVRSNTGGCMEFNFTTLGCPEWDLHAICAKGRDYGYDSVDFRGLQETMDIT